MTFILMHKTGKVPRLLASFAVQDDDSVRARVGIEYIPEGDMLANLIRAKIFL